MTINQWRAIPWLIIRILSDWSLIDLVAGGAGVEDVLLASVVHLERSFAEDQHIIQKFLLRSYWLFPRDERLLKLVELVIFFLFFRTLFYRLFLIDGKQCKSFRDFFFFLVFIGESNHFLYLTLFLPDVELVQRQLVLPQPEAPLLNIVHRDFLLSSLKLSIRQESVTVCLGETTVVPAVHGWQRVKTVTSLSVSSYFMWWYVLAETLCLLSPPNQTHCWIQVNSWNNILTRMRLFVWLLKQIFLPRWIVKPKIIAPIECFTLKERANGIILHASCTTGPSIPPNFCIYR